MHEVDVEGLLAAVDDPLLRHQLDRRRVLRAWVGGDAAVIEQSGTPGSAGPALLCLGPAHDLDDLMAATARLVGRPGRVVVEAWSFETLPAPWILDGSHRWSWLLTRRPPAGVESHTQVDVLDVVRDRAAIDAVLAVANPGTSARRDLSASECWLGVRSPDDDRLVAVGTLVRREDGSGHLAGIAVLPDTRRAGVGSAITTALTRRALAPAPHVATLGHYDENAGARRLYGRLGFETVRRFVSVTGAPLS